MEVYYQDHYFQIQNSKQILHDISCSIKTITQEQTSK
jgi:hypothetical protein